MRATVTLSKPGTAILKVGDVIGTRDIAYLRKLCPVQVKQREMIARMLKKTFRPRFEISFVDTSIPYQTRIQIRAKNF